MEEAVGKIWHRWISQRAYRGHPEARVTLDDMSALLGVYFRALGGDAGLRLTAVNRETHRARRSFLQRLAGSGHQIELAWRDDETLRLPATLESLPTTALNRQHYLWLTALASVAEAPQATNLSWIARAQAQTLAVCQRYPGLKSQYLELAHAHIAERPNVQSLSPQEARAENDLRQALLNPGSIDELPDTEVPPTPVPLWLHPHPPSTVVTTKDSNDVTQENAAGKVRQGGKRKYQTERQELPEKGTPSLLTLRHETDIFSLAEMLKINRAPEEDEQPDSAEQMADDLEYLTIARDKKASASRVRFDLDLPAAESDATELSEGHLYPEWDYRKNAYLPNHARVIPTLGGCDEEAQHLPEHLKRPAEHLKRQFESLKSERLWVRQQEDGPELDLQAVVAHNAERGLSHRSATPALYCQLLNRQRDMSTLVLADLSLSTEASIDDEQCVIDVIRDSLFLLSECLHQCGDRFALYGFSSRRRERVRFQTLKGFEDPYNAKVRQHLHGIKPGLYTRMGAAIRQANKLLQVQSTQQKVLLMISDGKPNDLDQYEGRYGLEDTRRAIKESRQLGLIPYCVTIDRAAESYLPYVFGHNGYCCIKQAAQLPQALPALYAQLTQA